MYVCMYVCIYIFPKMYIRTCFTPLNHRFTISCHVYRRCLLCKNVLGRRAATLKMLSNSMYDRRVQICAYALMGYDANVIMIECWRRWKCWWRNKRRFTQMMWSYRYNYYATRSGVIFEHWKDYVAYLKASGLTKRDLHIKVTIYTDIYVHEFVWICVRIYVHT
jgi:hypothetical protein